MTADTPTKEKAPKIANASFRPLSLQLKKYRENEQANKHAENVCLLASIVGTARQVQIAKLFWDVQILLGHSTSDLDFRKAYNHVHSDCWQKFVKACQEAGIEI